MDPPPEDFTWDEMIDEAVENGTAVEVQAAPVRGPGRVDQLADRGRRRPDRQRAGRRGGGRHRQARGGDREQARQVAGGAARACPPTARTRRARASRRAAPTTRSTTRSSIRAPRRCEDFQKNIGWARYPRTDKDKPSRAAAGRHQHRRVGVLEEAGPRLRGGRVPGQPGAPGPERRAGRPAAHHRVGVRRPEGAEGVPVRRRAARVDRRRRAASGDAGLQRHLAGDPEDLPPARRGGSGRGRGDSCATGSRRPPKGRSSDGGRHHSGPTAAAADEEAHDRPREGRAQARLDCCARPR